MLRNLKPIKHLFFIIMTTIITMSILMTFSEPDSASASPKSKSGLFLGTVINISVFDPISDDRFEKIFTNSAKKLNTIENKMSVNIPSSEVCKINDNAGLQAVSVSPETFFVVNKGKYYSSLSDGHFDITIGPLVNLWGIGSENARIPSDDEIRNSLSSINFQNVHLNDLSNSVELKDYDMQLDLGAIAKGYAADTIRDYLQSENVQSALINLGGNIYALGSKPGADYWNIGIQNPTDIRGAYVGIVHVTNKCVVTSGIYERFFIDNDQRYHHILNPFTGYPVNNELASVSIIADHSIDADGLSTSVFSLGITKGSDLLESIEGVDAIFITKDNDVYMTSGLHDKFTITNSDFVLMTLASK